MTTTEINCKIYNVLNELDSLDDKKSTIGDDLELRTIQKEIDSLFSQLDSLYLNQFIGHVFMETV